MGLLGSGCDGGRLTDGYLEALPLLKALELYNIPFLAFAPPLGERLEELCIYGKTIQTVSESLRGIANLRQLRVLKLACKDASTRLPEFCFFGIARACARLQVVDIYSVTDVSSRLLACIASNVRRLTDFKAFSTHLYEESDAVLRFR